MSNHEGPVRDWPHQRSGFTVAGMVAANQQLGAQVGFIQPAMYAAKARAAFNDI